MKTFKLYYGAYSVKAKAKDKNQALIEMRNKIKNYRKDGLKHKELRLLAHERMAPVSENFVLTIETGLAPVRMK